MCNWGCVARKSLGQKSALSCIFHSVSGAVPHGVVAHGCTAPVLPGLRSRVKAQIAEA